MKAGIEMKTEIHFLSDVEAAITRKMNEGLAVIAMWEISTAHQDQDITKMVITFGRLPQIEIPVVE